MAKNKEFEKLYKEEGKKRVSLRKQKRMQHFIDNPGWRQRQRNFTCNMNYTACNKRGYCNGDC